LERGKLLIIIGITGLVLYCFLVILPNPSFKEKRPSVMLNSLWPMIVSNGILMNAWKRMSKDIGAKMFFLKAIIYTANFLYVVGSFGIIYGFPHLLSKHMVVFAPYLLAPAVFIGLCYSRINLKTLIRK